MKLLHAVALASVGWYLMMPPPLGPHDVVPADRNVPLSAWQLAQSFDTATECERSKREMTKLAQTKMKQNSSFENRQLVFQFGAAHCIATDDPRLAK
jgi:hypothetical protein